MRTYILQIASQSRSHVSFVVVARSKAAPSRQPPNESHTHSSRHLTVRERTCRRQTRVDLTVACGWMWTDRQTKAVRRLGTRAANTYVTDGSMLRSGSGGAAETASECEEEETVRNCGWARLFCPAPPGVAALDGTAAHGWRAPSFHAVVVVHTPS